MLCESLPSDQHRGLCRMSSSGGLCMWWATAWAAWSASSWPPASPSASAPSPSSPPLRGTGRACPGASSPCGMLFRCSAWLLRRALSAFEHRCTARPNAMGAMQALRAVDALIACAQCRCPEQDGQAGILLISAMRACAGHAGKDARGQGCGGPEIPLHARNP